MSGAKVMVGRLSRCLGVLGMALVLALSAGCGGGGSSSEGGTSLRWAFWGSSARAAIAEKAVAAYTAAHPDVQVTVEYADWGPYWDKLATQYAGRDAPDVVMMDNGYLGDYANRGALADLSAVGGVDTAQLDQQVVEGSKIGGTLYSMTTGVNAQAVVVNQKVFADAGVEIPDDSSWTWEDYADVAAEVTRKSPKGTYGAKTTNYVDPWVLQRGTPYFDAEGQVAVPPASVASAFAFEKSLVDRGISPSASVTTEDDTSASAQSLMNTNKIGMGVFWSSEVVGIARATGSDVTLLQLPRQTDGSTAANSGSYLKAAQSWAISSQSDQQEEAARFIDFLVNDPDLAKEWAVTLGAPVNLDNREAITAGLGESDKLALDYVDELGDDAQDPPPLPPAGGNSLGAELGRAQTEALFGRLSPEQAAEQFVDAIRRSVADAQ